MRPKGQAQSPPDLIPSDKAPVHTIRHRSLKASIWKNETKKGMMYKVTVVRSYREGEEWHDTHESLAGRCSEDFQAAKMSGVDACGGLELLTRVKFIHKVVEFQPLYTASERK